MVLSGAVGFKHVPYGWRMCIERMPRTSKITISQQQLTAMLMMLLAHCQYSIVGRGGALVESMPFDLRVVGSNPALAPRRDLGQVLHLQLPVALRHVNSN